MKKLFPVILALLLATIPARALDLGDKAPEISAASWVTGDPADPTKTDGETIYLVEVWSTTCPPCIRSIPLLNDLQSRYAENGLKIISFTPDKEEDVTPFLEQHPMEYSSFLDKEGATYINYMAADNRNTIPHAFLFDKSGALVWIGNPLDNIESRVKQVIDGTLTLDKALAVRDARDNLQAAFEMQDVDGMLKALVALEELEPDNGQYYQVHYRILSELGVGDDSEIRSLLDAWFEGSHDRAEDLMMLSMVAFEQGHPGKRNPELALAAAKRAYALDSLIKTEAGINLAEMYKNIGRIDLSLKLLSEMAANVPPDNVDLFSAIQDFYGRLRDLGKNPDAEYKAINNE